MLVLCSTDPFTTTGSSSWIMNALTARCVHIQWRMSCTVVRTFITAPIRNGTPCLDILDKCTSLSHVQNPPRNRNCLVRMRWVKGIASHRADGIAKTTELEALGVTLTRFALGGSTRARLRMLRGRYEQQSCALIIGLPRPCQGLLRGYLTQQP